MDVVGLCQLQRIVVAVCQLHSILRGAGVDGTHRMDDVLCIQPVALGDLCFAGAAAVQGAALGKQLRPCCPVNGSIHATAAQQAAVGCIHDAVTVQLGNVSLHDFQLVFDLFGTHGISSSKRSCIKYTRKLVSCEYITPSSAQGQAEHFQRCIIPLATRQNRLLQAF